MEQTQRAHAIILYADADMSFDEILSLLCENGIHKDVAWEVARDVRSEEE